MTRTGYDQYFKKARQNADRQAPPTAEPKVLKVADHQKKLASDLRKRLEKKRIQVAKKKSPPWLMIIFCAIGFAMAGAGYLHHEKVDRFVRNLDIGWGSPASANEGASSQASEPQKTDEAKAAEKPATVAPKTEFTDEELNHFARMNERKRELDAREEELNRMEAEILAQREELEKKLQAVEKTRREISSVLQEKVEVDEKKIETLVQMYSNMKPQQAAKIFEEMDEDLAVQIIGRMKKKNSAEIMNLMKSEKAKTFTEKFSGYKSN